MGRRKHRCARQERVPLPVSDQGGQPHGLNELLQRIRLFAVERKWGATALVIDVDRSR